MDGLEWFQTLLKWMIWGYCTIIFEWFTFWHQPNHNPPRNASNGKAGKSSTQKCRKRVGDMWVPRRVSFTVFPGYTSKTHPHQREPVMLVSWKTEEGVFFRCKSQGFAMIVPCLGGFLTSPSLRCCFDSVIFYYGFGTHDGIHHH